jgi:hypothetical protein
MLIATFGPTTGWVGKTITFENDTFVLQDHGPISASDVMQYDQQGHLVWGNDQARALVEAKAQGAVAPAPVAGEPTSPTGEAHPQHPTESYAVTYGGGHPAYPKTESAHIELKVLDDHLELLPIKWFAGLTIPYSTVRGFELSKKNGRPCVFICYEDDTTIIIQLMLTGFGEGKKCRELGDRLRAAQIPEVDTYAAASRDEAKQAEATRKQEAAKETVRKQEAAKETVRKQEAPAPTSLRRRREEEPEGISEWPVDHDVSDMDVVMVYFCEDRLQQVPVVGVSNYQPQLKRLGGRVTDDGLSRSKHEVALLPEPSNAYDSNAVRVMVLPDKLVGHLSRDNAVKYRPAIDGLAQRGFILGAVMMLVGGEEYEEWGDDDDDDDSPKRGRENIGGRLLIPAPDDVLPQFRAAFSG